MTKAQIKEKLKRLDKVEKQNAMLKLRVKVLRQDRRELQMFIDEFQSEKRLNKIKAALKELEYLVL